MGPCPQWLQVSIPENYYHGGFFYHDFGVRMKGGKLAIVYFTGRHRHGAAAPSPPPGETPVHWAYRVAVICYPNRPTMEGNSRNPLAPFCGFDFIKKDLKAGDNERRTDVLKIPPEIRFRQRCVILPL